MGLKFAEVQSACYNISIVRYKKYKLGGDVNENFRFRSDRY